jgi:hypothetical protein
LGGQHGCQGIEALIPSVGVHAHGINASLTAHAARVKEVAAYSQTSQRMSGKDDSSLGHC